MAKYDEWISPEGLLKLEDWARQGFTDEQIAQKMNISRSTLSDWKKRFSDISDTLKKGKDVVDIQVENKLLQRALGYSYTETTRERVEDAKTGKSIMVVTKEVTKEVIPDTTAQIFWLKNRRKDTWKDKQNVEVNGKLDDEKNKLDDLIKQINGR